MNCKTKTKKMEKHKILFYQYPQKKQQHHEELKHINNGDRWTIKT